MIFCLAKILRPKKLRQTNDLRALLCGAANEIDGVREILVRIRAASHLHESHFRHLRFSHLAINHEAHEDHEDEAVNFVFMSFVVTNYFSESAGTILMLSIATRLVGLLISPALFRVTAVSPILSSTSLPLISFPNVVYW